MRKQKPYSRIPTPALPGSGSRDRTALRHISASLRQRPLDCGTIVARRVKDVKWLLGNGYLKSDVGFFCFRVFEKGGCSKVLCGVFSFRAVRGKAVAVKFYVGFLSKGSLHSKSQASA